MANVVGILVVVMAFTQIHVGEALRRIHTIEAENAALETAAALEAGRPIDVRDALHREHRRLVWSLRDLDPPTSTVERDIRQLESQISRLARLQAGSRASMESEAALAARLEKQAHQLASMEAELERSESARLQLRFELDEADGRRGDKPNLHRIRLPDPRPAPVGTQEYTFFARFDRVTPVDLDGLERKLNVAIRNSHQLPQGRGAFGSSVLVGYFRSNDIGDRRFRWRLSDRAGYGVSARLQWRREDIGETWNDLVSDRSRYREILRHISRRERFLLFHVWSDSYAPYLLAREIAEKIGFSVGWRVHDADAEFEGILAAQVPEDPIPID